MWGFSVTLSSQTRCEVGKLRTEVLSGLTVDACGSLGIHRESEGWIAGIERYSIMVDSHFPY